MTNMTKETVIAGGLSNIQSGYIKLSKNTKGYNWEIKVLDEKEKDLKKVIDEVTRLNDEMIARFGEE